MGKKAMKGAAIAALLGSVFGWWGCGGSGGGWWGRILGDTVLYLGQEFVLDNNGVVDLFTDN
jgi:hypothetical protein